MSEHDLRDAILQTALQLQRLSAGEQAKVDAILRELSRELKALLQSQTLSEAGKAEVNELIRQANDIIDPAYARVASSLDTHGLALIVADKTVKAIEDVIPQAIASPTAERLASLTKDVLIHGAPSSAWWSKQSEDTQFRFAAEVRQGVINGETNERIVQRVVGKRGEPGIMDVARRNARTLVHSSIMAAANDARLATFRKNARFVAGVRWLSTLDSSTCFSADTLVLMADGSEKPIAEVREGEFVIGGVSGEPRRVFATMKRLAQSSVVIHCDGRYVGRATKEHPILTPSGWRQAGSVGLSPDVSEREVLCRRLEATECPFSGAQQASGGLVAPCDLPRVGEARRAYHADYRQGDELRDGVCNGASADCAAEHESAERLQHDGRRGWPSRRGPLGCVAGEDHGKQPAQGELAARGAEASGSDLAQLERSGLPAEGECRERGAPSCTPARSRMESKARGQVCRGNAPQVARPRISGEDGGEESARHSARGSQAGCSEAACDHEHGRPFSDGPEVVGHEETVAVGRITAVRETAEVQVYNLSVEDDPTFVAGGVIVHNCVQCAALDGAAWDLDGDRIKGTHVDFLAPPAHFDCRCVLSPIPKIEFTGGTRASSQGQVDATTTFADFLKRQSPEFVDKVLGARRAELFLDGKLTLSDLISGTGRELTLEELGA